MTEGFGSGIFGSYEEDIEVTTCLMVSGIVILIFVILNTCRELVQIYQQKYHYLMDPMNFVSWLLYISATVMVSPIFMGSKCDIQFSAASITVFLSWFNLLLFLQRFDQASFLNLDPKT